MIYIIEKAKIFIKYFGLNFGDFFFIKNYFIADHAHMPPFIYVSPEKYIKFD